MEAIAGAEEASDGSCFARNRASFGITKMMKEHQAVQRGGVNPLLRALSGQDAGNAS